MTQPMAYSTHDSARRVVVMKIQLSALDMGEVGIRSTSICRESPASGGSGSRKGPGEVCGKYGRTDTRGVKEG